MTRLSIVVLTLVVLGAPVPAEVMGAEGPTEAELQAEFKERHAALKRLKDAGKVGETATGMIALVRDAGGDEKVEVPGEGKVTVASFVRTENTGRGQLYAVIGERTGETAAQVGAQAALRNFNRAKPTHWLELEDGRWIQKKDLPEG